MPLGKRKQAKTSHSAETTTTTTTPNIVYGSNGFPSTYSLSPAPPYSPPFHPPSNLVPYSQNWSLATTSHFPPSPQPSPPQYPPQQPYLEFPANQSLPVPQSQASGKPKKWKSYTNLKTAVAQPVKVANQKTSNYITNVNNKTTNYVSNANKQATNYIGSANQRTTNYVTNKSTNYLNCSAALYDRVWDKLNDVLTCIDDESFHGGEKELAVEMEETITSPEDEAPTTGIRGGGFLTPTAAKNNAAKGANAAVTTVVTNTNYFSKANLYGNARLKHDLPPLHVYIPTYPLLCLAAQYSQRVYTKPKGAEKDTHVNADWRMGTKAMVIKSVPVDDMNTVVFAIRGTQTFMDWAVNLQSEPASPTDFLEDVGNLCHAGFLDVARKTIKPVAARLRQLLEENPSRASCSLLITGHSAGGAVAALLYCHMLSRVETELSILTGYFKRIHCVTFGAPPVSLLPLIKPAAHSHDGSDKRLRKSLFLSFVNEFDPVPRADKAYIKSLLELYASPAPKSVPDPSSTFGVNGLASASKLNLALALPKPKLKPSTQSLKPSTQSLKPLTYRPKTAPPHPQSAAPQQPTNVKWSVPPSALSNAGRLVALRVPWGGPEEDVRACVVTDEQLREVVWGDPLMHQMKVYARRVELLATKAVTGRLNG